MSDQIDQDPIPPSVFDEAVEAAGGVQNLADCLDVHRQTIWHWRNGKRKCSHLRARGVRPDLKKLLED